MINSNSNEFAKTVVALDWPFNFVNNHIKNLRNQGNKGRKLATFFQATYSSNGKENVKTQTKGDAFLKNIDNDTTRYFYKECEARFNGRSRNGTILDKDLMPHKVESVKHMVDQIINDLTTSKKNLQTLIIIGHGANACISTGSGQYVEYSRNAAKIKAMQGSLEKCYIGLDNTQYWVPEIKRLKDYCSSSLDILFLACSTGDGHANLGKLAGYFSEALEVEVNLLGPDRSIDNNELFGILKPAAIYSIINDGIYPPTEYEEWDSEWGDEYEILTSSEPYLKFSKVNSSESTLRSCMK